LSGSMSYHIAILYEGASKSGIISSLRFVVTK
jgi:hypothetical protein